MKSPILAAGLVALSLCGAGARAEPQAGALETSDKSSQPAPPFIASSLGPLGDPGGYFRPALDDPVLIGAPAIPIYAFVMAGLVPAIPILRTTLFGSGAPGQAR
jgi:hypothetical protein